MDQELSGNAELTRSERSTTILLVEDEEFVREVAADVLREAGYRVWSAANASQAVTIYDKSGSEIDLLFTDLILPGDTGWALAKKLREKNPKLRVLFATGYGCMKSDAERNEDECLAKPFSGGELLRRVERVLGRAAEIGSELAVSYLVEGSSGGLGQIFCV